MLKRCRRGWALSVLLLWATLALALDPQKELRQYGHRSWQTDSGLPQNTVHAITQTSDGYLWLATEGGLVRFDGTQFVVYDGHGSAHLPSVNVNSLFEDRSSDLRAGRSELWIGTEDGLVRRDFEGGFRSFRTADGLPSNTIWATLATTGGALWVVTPEGLGRRRQDGFDAIRITEGISNPRSFTEGASGSLWIGTRAGVVQVDSAGLLHPKLLPGLEVQTVAIAGGGRVWAGTRAGLFDLGAGGADNPRPLEGLPSGEISTLYTGRDDALWIGTGRGVAVLRQGVLTRWTTRDGLPDDRVQAIQQDREGAVWISTSHGVARIYNGRLQRFAERDGVADGAVLSLLEDREGSLWLGTESGGLEMLRDQKFTTYTTAEGLSDDLTRAILQDRTGRVWVGTNGGGLDRFRDSAFTARTTRSGLSSNIVLALGSDTAGTVWAGTPDGLNRIEAEADGSEKIRTLTSADGLADDFVRSIYAASDGSLWAGTRRGLSHLQNGRFTNYSALDGLGSDLVGTMIEDHRDDRERPLQPALWVGTLGGLSRLERGRFTNLTVRDGLSSNVITALYQDHEGTLWIGTDHGGLNRLHAGRITTYPAERSHLPDSIYGILEDGVGNLWLSSKSGIYRVARRELDDFAEHGLAVLNPVVYGTSDGMKISECSSGGHPAAWKLTDGTMWFATLRGVAAVDPEHLSLNALAPPVTIEDVLIDDRSVKPQGELKLPPGRSRFEFHYAGLSFIAPQKVRYRYKLDGFDREWVEAGTRRTAYYTNLSPGSYRFRVLACNNDGVWNETGAAIGLLLRPHYYQTWWFYLLLAAALGLMAYQVYRWRLQQAELSFAAVLSERGRIAREIHDTLAQGLVGISVQLEVVNRLLTSSVDGAREQLDQARSLVRESLSEARSSIWDLRSQAAESRDFAARLAQMAASATERSVPKIQVKSKVSGTYRPLTPKVEAELLRIAQEAVNNAVRHAKPAQIAVELRFGARELQMTIQDDGCGFDGQAHPQSSGPEGHFGLAGMRERAEEIDGELKIESIPGKGTRVQLHLGIDG